MTAFDPIRAQREILAGLHDVHKVITARERDAERRLAEAEAEQSALAKLSRFVMDLVAQAHDKLNALIEAETNKGKSEK